MNCGGEIGLARREDPEIWKLEPFEGDAVVHGEFVNILGHATSRKIGRAAAHHTTDRPNPGGDEAAAVRQLTYSECQIDMVFEEIDHPVV